MATTKTKKLSPEQKLRGQLTATSVELKRATDRKNEYYSILEQIRKLVGGSRSFGANVVEIDELPQRVADLQSFKNYHQGAITAERMQVEDQKEIIRWLINPQTATEAPKKTQPLNY